MPDSLQLFEWRDLVDIAVVAFVIYRIILLLKGRVAVRLLFSLAFVAILYSLSRTAGLDTFRWLLDSVFGSLVLILVVIFQSDIRRALVTMGKTRPATSEHDQDEASEVLDELVSAMTNLSARRHGALIVVEREMGIMAHVETGTEIDAKITSEILTSIFLPYSPIHDGAVIVRKGKLTRAGCFLPLTQNPNVGKSLGTRHRAAIGLSELTDAVLLVVSEETGMMSVVVGGKLTSVADGLVLRKLLKRLLEPRWLT